MEDRLAVFRHEALDRPMWRSPLISTLTELELRQLDSMSREQLISRLLEFKDNTPVEFCQELLEQQGTDRLRLLLLAVKLIRVLRQPSSCPRTERRPLNQASAGLPQHLEPDRPLSA
jgi:hypothetical protein